MNQSEQDGLARDIEVTFLKGGSFSHNIISSKLRRLATVDRERADKIFDDLKERGF